MSISPREPSLSPVLSKYLLTWSRDSAGTRQSCSGRGSWGGLEIPAGNPLPKAAPSSHR